MTVVIGTVLDIKENFGIGGLAEIIRTYWRKDLKDDYLASCSIEELLTYPVQLFTSIDIPDLQFQQESMLRSDKWGVGVCVR